MREIKFRAWHKHKKKTIFGPNDENESPGWVVTLAQSWDGEIPLMQFTGLKDKNGKEIYEGDLVTLCNFNHRNSDLSLNREKSIEYNQRGIVEWMPYCCSFMAVERHLQLSVYDQWNNSIALRPSKIDNYEIEVIGNIYDNRELLKK